MKDLMSKEIKVELNNVHSISALAFATVYNWVNEFKCDRTFTCDALRSDRSFFVKELLKSIVKRLRCFVNVQFMQNMYFMQNIQLNILYKYPQSSHN